MSGRINTLDTLFNGAFPGNHLTTTHSTELMSLPWRSTDGKPPLAVIRIMPEVIETMDEENNPVREELALFMTDPDNITQLLPSYWMVRGIAVWKIGNPSVSFFVQNPLVDDPRAYMHMEEPAGLLAVNVQEAIKAQTAPQVWTKMADEGVLPKKRFLPRIGLVQAAVYQNRDIENSPKGLCQEDKMPIVAMTDALSSRLLTLFCQTFKDDAQHAANAVDVWDRIDGLKHGNIFGLEDEDARFLAVARDTVPIDQLLGLRGGANGQGAVRNNYGTRRGNTAHETSSPIENYDYRLLTQFTDLEGAVHRPVFSPDMADWLRQRIQPWDQVIRVHTREQQIQLLHSAIPYDVLEYCWADHPDWIPGPDSDCYKRFVSSASVPNAGLPATRGQSRGGVPHRTPPIQTVADVALAGAPVQSGFSTATRQLQGGAPRQQPGTGTPNAAPFAGGTPRAPRNPRN